MEVEQQHKLEVKKILESGNGFTLNEIFREAKNFNEKTDLISVLRLMSQQAEIFKQVDKYYLFNQTPIQTDFEVTNEISQLLEKAGLKEEKEIIPEPKSRTFVLPAKPKEIQEVKEVVNKQKRKYKKKDIKPVLNIIKAIPTDSIIMGTLKRGNAAGRIASLLYFCSGWLSLKELAEILKSSTHSIYIQATMLVSGKYLEIKKVGKSNSYRWTGHYKYPFDYQLESDKDIYKNIPLFFKPMFEQNEEIVKVEIPVATITEEKVSDNSFVKIEDEITMTVDNSSILKVIDIQISIHQVQINALNELKQKYLNN